MAVPRAATVVQVLVVVALLAHLGMAKTAVLVEQVLITLVPVVVVRVAAVQLLGPHQMGRSLVEQVVLPRMERPVE